MTDYAVSAANERKNWKEVTNPDPGMGSIFGGDDVANLFSGAQKMNMKNVQFKISDDRNVAITVDDLDFSTYKYAFRDNDKELLSIDTKNKTIDLHTSELYNQNYQIKNNGFDTILTDLKNMNLSLQFELDDARQKVKQYQWAMQEIMAFMDRIKLEWNTKPYMVSTVGDLLSKLDQFVRSKR